MAICSFLGGEIFDTGLDAKIEMAVNQIVEDNETIVFLLDCHGGFYSKCILAALRAKARQPQKVTITLVLNKPYTSYMQHQDDGIPSCMIDKVIIPTDAQRDGHIISRTKQLHWVLQKSTHLISYMYKPFLESNRKFLDFAEELPSLKIMDMTNPKTEQTIIDNYSLLTEKQQIVFQGLASRQLHSDVAATLNVSKSRISQIHTDGRRTLHNQMSSRYYRVLKKLRPRKEYTCGVFIAGKVTYETLKRFENIAYYLIKRYDVKKFYIHHTLINSAFVYVLTNLHPPLHITAVTNDSVCSENQDISADFCPPFNAIECAGGVEHRSNHSLGIIADMIEQSDFCICDLSTTTLSDEIKKCASRGKGTVILDTSRTYPEDMQLF